MEPVLLFGYGSLIGIESIERTIRRPIVPGSVKIARLNHWIRSWSYVAPCIFQKNGKELTLPTVFLNIEPHESTAIEGVLFEVAAEDLSWLDQRERGYRRVDVTSEVTTTMSGRVYTYVAGEGFDTPPPNAVVPKKYVDSVASSIQSWGSAFESNFWETTLNHDFVVKPGPYRFEHPGQEDASDRRES